MLSAGQRAVAIYVERSQSQWIIRDRDGAFWIVTPPESESDSAWESRQPFLITEETKLEPIPGHYLGMFGLHP